jgi:hypothetical protein
MATHTPEQTLSYAAAGTQPEQKAGSTDAGHRFAAMPAMAPSLGRRCEARKDYQCLCSYEVLEAIEEQSVVITQGKAVALNRSTQGMLLFMRQAPHAKQLIEVHTPRSRWCRTMMVLDVRWTRLVQVESFGDLYLVGCRRTFGPCHYLSF